MSNLFVSTLTMMGLTFLIGFFVAGVIKVIANWADFLDFYGLHQQEIQELKKAHKMEHKLAHVMSTGEDEARRRHGKLIHVLNETMNDLKPRKRITA